MARMWVHRYATRSRNGGAADQQEENAWREKMFRSKRQELRNIVKMFTHTYEVARRTHLPMFSVPNTPRVVKRRDTLTAAAWKINAVESFRKKVHDRCVDMLIINYFLELYKRKKLEKFPVVPLPDILGCREGERFVSMVVSLF